MITYENGVCYRTLDFLGYPDYRVGFDGTIWAFRLPGGKPKTQKAKFARWKILKPAKILRKNRKTIYHSVDLHENKQFRSYYVHILVLLAFVGPRPLNMQTCHYDDNGENNHLDNLRWDTKQNNELDKLRNKYNIKISDIKSIRDSKLKNVDLAKLYNLSPKVIGDIKLRKTWKTL